MVPKGRLDQAHKVLKNLAKDGPKIGKEVIYLVIVLLSYFSFFCPFFKCFLVVD